MMWILALVLQLGASHAFPKGCLPQITPPATPPRLATSYNGIALEDVCFDNQTDDDALHFFAISDWGGIPYGGGPPVPADLAARSLVKGVDMQAQQRVAAQMAERAKINQPRFVLNAGDMFYWNGLETHCGLGMTTLSDPKKQFSKVFEQVYIGEELKSVPWLGTLGNHDFGGRAYTSGWDQIIAFTWGPSGRWVTPALYWRQRVHHLDFTADFFFVDSNVNDVSAPGTHKFANLCGANASYHPNISTAMSNSMLTCGEQGPTSPSDCVSWFHALWKDQVAWLEKELYDSTGAADWQIVVTHFPPEGNWQLDTWKHLSASYGIDLFVTGHRHQQEVHVPGTKNPLGTTYVVSGGGGGIMSEKKPSADGHDDQYGFFDIAITRHTLNLSAISHGGILRSTTVVEPRVGMLTQTSTSTTTTSSTMTSTTTSSTSMTTSTTATSTETVTSTTTSSSTVTLTTVTRTRTTMTRTTSTATRTTSTMKLPISNSDPEGIPIILLLLLASSL
ncbi:unnamed protein product [Polarella glacialis]|uniref:Calcineurin-like phosphoesterase domain-containing protein n=2 Tax=Polarella glacialis TaxID=89957 RepID=A0A813IET0_POLGL|nr:unnamed protein product [Polarella glacialis]|mmetsp:Transcript_79971/g.144355  ORF Transcript_79971/g.144355 Transcript_79971/m.144355 type:complete len:505 (+) Transcript_79971:109-1623(+)